MTRKEELRDNYEDALFALLMESVIEEEGKRLIEENERLKNDPTFEVPDEVKQRCTKTIRKAFARKNRKSSGKVAYRAFSNVAAVILLCGLLFTVAYAAVPEIRVSTLNLLIEVSDVSAKLTLQGEKGEIGLNETLPAPSGEGDILLGYQFPAAPEGFYFNPAFSQSEQDLEMSYYESKSGSYLVYCVSAAFGSSLDIDTEGADSFYEIKINGHPGMAIVKGDRIQIVWADTDHAVFCSVSCKGIDAVAAMALASNAFFVGSSPN